MTRDSAFDAGRVAAEIRAALHALPDRSTPSVRALRREYSRRLVRASADEVYEIATCLLDDESNSPGHLRRFIAYELITRHRAALGSIDAKRLTRLGRGIDSWGAVDTFGCYLSGPAWRARHVPDALIVRWARSRDRWWRRAALVSTVPLNRKTGGGTGDTPRTLMVCRMLAGDRDDMVAKALSWALRELAVRDPNAARAFLSEHKDVLASRVRREVSNKLATGLKSGRRHPPRGGRPSP